MSVMSLSPIFTVTSSYSHFGIYVNRHIKTKILNEERELNCTFKFSDFHSFHFKSEISPKIFNKITQNTAILMMMMMITSWWHYTRRISLIGIDEIIQKHIHILYFLKIYRTLLAWPLELGPDPELVFFVGFTGTPLTPPPPPFPLFNIVGFAWIFCGLFHFWNEMNRSLKTSEVVVILFFKKSKKQDYNQHFF